jgi:hypothetical protein
MGLDTKNYWLTVRQSNVTSTLTYSAVESSVVECSPAGKGNWRISIAKIRYQDTSSENIAEE